MVALDAGTVLLAGLAGPALVLASLADRFALGGDAPWYVLTLLSIGYIEPPSGLVALVWAAAAAQLFALTAHRYAPAGRARGGRFSWVGGVQRVVRRRPRSIEPAAVGEADEA